MGRYELDRKVHKRVGPITYVAVKVDDDSPDLSHLGEYYEKNGTPDYPYYDRAVGCLVVGERTVTKQKWLLFRQNPSETEWRGDIPPGGQRWTGETLADESEDTEAIKQRLLAESWEPKTFAAAGLVPVIERDTDEDVTVYEAYEQGPDKKHTYAAFRHGKNGEVTQEQHTETIRVPVPVEYDPQEAENRASRREYRYIAGFQNDPNSPSDFAAEESGFRNSKDKVSDDAYGTERLAAVAYCLQDARRLEDYGNGWSCVGVIVEARLGEVSDKGEGGTLIERSPGLWGIETDSDDSYFDEVAEEQMYEISPDMLVEQLEAEAKRSKELARGIKTFLKTMKVKK